MTHRTEEEKIGIGTEAELEDKAGVWSLEGILVKLGSHFLER